jgi:multidrug efflux pump subunit AcrB
MAADTPAWFRFLFLKPIFGILFTATLVMLGLVGQGAMIKEDSPDLAIPQAIVSTEWPGASPELVEKEVTEELEKKLRSLKGLKRYRSGSFASWSVISVEFDAGAPLDESMQSLRSKVEEAVAEFPQGVKKPKTEQVSITDIPIVTFMLHGDVGAALLGATARDLQKRLETIKGVRKVELAGALKEAVRVQLLPERLKALGLPPTLVAQAIREANHDVPLGAFENEDFGFSIEFSGRHQSIEGLRRLPVARIDQGRVVRLDELARVTADLEAERTRTSMSWQGGEFHSGVAISVSKSGGQDSIAIITAAKEMVREAQSRAEWPHGLESSVVADQSEIIEANLSSVFQNGWQAMLAVFVILLILLTWREALVAGLSIPLTFLGAIGVLYLMGYTLNTVVIIGMVLALGLLVDVFILVMEGMHEGLYVKGQSFDQAAAGTVKSYAMPALAGQLTTILAMAPLFAIGGVDGKFIRLIPVTAVTCLVLSFCIAFMVNIPLSRFIFGKSTKGVRKTAVDRVTERASASLAAWLQRTVLASRLRSVLVCLSVLALLVLSVHAAGYLPSELYPKADGRNLAVSIELMPEDTLERSQAVADAVGRVLRDKPYFTAVTQYVGQISPYAQSAISDLLGVSKAPYLVGFTCLFTPKDQRDKAAFEYLPELRAELEEALARTPGARLLLTPELGGASPEDPIQIEVLGRDLDVLRSLAAEVRAMLAEVPGATDLRDNLGPPAMKVRLEPRAEALDFYGLSQQELAAQLRLYMEADPVARFAKPGEDLDIFLGVRWHSREGELGGPTTFEELTSITVATPKAELMPVLALTTPRADATPLVVTRKDGSRAVTVKAKTENRTAQEILDELLPRLEQAAQAWPEGYSFDLSGEAESSAETYGSVAQVFLIALFLVFAVMALLFSSFSQPFIIMFTVPFAFIGTFGGFFLAGIPISFPAMVGVIALVGIVVNDAIVMVETMNAHRATGMPLRDAAARGASDRLRPIISTTLTTTVGLVPLALSDPLWMPLCSAIIFGLLAATVIALVVIPSMYLLLGERIAVREIL